jgi:hypothetical protein
METDKKILDIKIIDACGRADLKNSAAILVENGYEEGELTQEGRFSWMAIDGAPGWADWWYEISIVELPDKPLDRLFPPRVKN